MIRLRLIVIKASLKIPECGEVDIMKSKPVLLTASLAVASMLVGLIGLSSCSSFGDAPSGELLARIKASPQYEKDGFVNVVAQSSQTMTASWRMMTEQFTGDQVRVPPSSIPVMAVSPERFKTRPEFGLRSIWLGHAGVLLELDGVRLLVDPVFSERASPVSFAGPKRFHPPPVPLSALQNIDAVVISHDHYDHLDMPTIQHLASKAAHFYVPLGIGAHLRRWGVPEDQITDMQWWESKSVGKLQIICTPSRHYSGRDLTDYKATLWSSWTIVGPEHRVFYSGDTGFSDHFKQIADRFGPFDLNIIKVGAYGPSRAWNDIHFDPEQAVEAHGILGGKRMLPVHWATFNMAFHDWDEPIKRTLKAAAESGAEIITPRVGQEVTAGQPFQSQRWWEDVR
jgi:L-ascorbate metabolism protein UlaG (beta-lactamase superfamily)